MLAAGSLLSASSALATPPEPESPETGSASEVTNTTAILHGTVNPKAKATVAWFFEYNEGAVCTGGSTTPVHPSEEVEAQPAEAPLSGLQPGTQYTFCLVARNEAEEATEGNPVSFITTAVTPTVESEASSSLGANEAKLSAQINPEGSPATYQVEYGTSTEYGTNTPAAELPAALGAVGVAAQLSGLQPSTLYHFRFIATNALGTTRGTDSTFSTAALGASSTSMLPDDRAFELVSAVGSEEVFSPYGPIEFGDLVTLRPFRAAIDGDAVAYVAEPPSSREGGNGGTGKGLGQQYMAVREPGKGWTDTVITPPVGENEPATFAVLGAYEAFSNDLTLGIYHHEGSLLPAAAETNGPAKCSDLYSHTGISGGANFRALFTTTDTPGFCGGNNGFFPEPVFAGASADHSQLLFQTNAALIPEAKQAAGEGKANLYDSQGGHVSLVDVLPSHEVALAATFGGPSGTSENPPVFSNVISADGSRIFWTDLEEAGPYAGDLFVRESGTKTVQVSAGGAKYWTATPDGRYVLYTEGEKLWRFDVDRFNGSTKPEPEALAEAREELAGVGAGVQGVVGASEDGSYVYFVADGVLASNQNGGREQATVGNCTTARTLGEGGTLKESEEQREEEMQARLPAGRGCNLYVLHSGEATRFIATLSPKDAHLIASQGYSNGTTTAGDWAPDPGERTAGVTPDGRHLAFESKRQLTGYDDSGLGGEASERIEVFVYDVETARLSCGSCNPTGAPAINETPGFRQQMRGGYLPVSPPAPGAGGDTGPPRWMTDDGTRIFFDTGQPLVPRDTNGLQDVYEWERDGAGSCSMSVGCVYLLSAGTSRDNSHLVDASANGDDVFFTSRAPLVASTSGIASQLYDARVNGGFPTTSLACTGTDCQGAPPAPPIFVTPSSVTFNGVGNFPTPPPGKAKTAAQIRAEKLAKALKSCRSKHNRHNRTVCERAARKRYGPTKAKKAGSKSSSHKAGK